MRRRMCSLRKKSVERLLRFRREIVVAHIADNSNHDVRPKIVVHVAVLNDFPERVFIRPFRFRKRSTDHANLL